MNGLSVLEKVAIRKHLSDDALFKRIDNAIYEMTVELEALSEETTDPRMHEDLPRILLNGGKRLRPVLAYLSYQMAVFDGSLTDDGAQKATNARIIPLMCMLELMHTVSLIHDDVVDSADKRRGVETINKTSGDDAAIRSGDFLLAKAMEKLKFYRGTGINEELAEVSAEMCRGELNQLTLRYNLDEQNEYSYYLCIRRKTAALLAGSCYCGALAAGMDKEKAEAIKAFGERFGLAFQIRDDVMDFSSSADSGKNVGQDIKNGILTLPILLAKEEMNDEMLSVLTKIDKTQGEIDSIIRFVRDTDALKNAEIKVKLLCEEAISFLDSFSKSSYKDALVTMVKTFVEI